MLQLTKRTEYGLIALVHMADRDDQYVSVREISERYRIPRRLLAEVLKDLCHAKVVESHRGATGGYCLARSPENLPLSEIVTALEGRPLLTSCDSSAPASHQGECGLVPVCPIRSPLHRIRENLWQLMQKTTLRSLVDPRPVHPTEIVFASTEVALR
ncbi:MAG: RrF2 family transcriptional regulator [Planctomycetota bacterium]